MPQVSEQPKPGTGSENGQFCSIRAPLGSNSR